MEHSSTVPEVWGVLVVWLEAAHKVGARGGHLVEQLVQLASELTAHLERQTRKRARGTKGAWMRTKGGTHQRGARGFGPRTLPMARTHSLRARAMRLVVGLRARRGWAQEQIRPPPPLFFFFLRIHKPKFSLAGRQKNKNNPIPIAFTVLTVRARMPPRPRGTLLLLARLLPRSTRRRRALAETGRWGRAQGFESRRGRRAPGPLPCGRRQKEREKELAWLVAPPPQKKAFSPSPPTPPTLLFLLTWPRTRVAAAARGSARWAALGPGTNKRPRRGAALGSRAVRGADHWSPTPRSAVAAAAKSVAADKMVSTVRALA